MTGKPRGRFYDITGRRYGRLVVLRKAESRSRQTSWDCRCDCGAEVNVLKHSLACGATLSCGCLMREKCAALGHAMATHGMRQSPEYSVWSGMLRRCRNPNEGSYYRYGGRGIEVQFASFEEFFAEVGPRPSPDHWIDRIDPDGHYAPGNVRWLHKRRQNLNKGNTFYVTIGSTTKPLKDWCEDAGVDYRRAWARIRQLGWSPERAIGLGVQA